MVCFVTLKTPVVMYCQVIIILIKKQHLPEKSLCNIINVTFRYESWEDIICDSEYNMLLLDLFLVYKSIKNNFSLYILLLYILLCFTRLFPSFSLVFNFLVFIIFNFFAHFFLNQLENRFGTRCTTTRRNVMGFGINLTYS